MYDVTLKTLAPRELVGVPHEGSYMAIDRAFERLGGTLMAHNLFRPDMCMVGIYLDDPDLVPEDRLRSFACVTEGQHVPTQETLVHQHLEGGEYAVLRHKGPYADMHKAYQWLYGVWLPQSDREFRDTVRFEEYVNNPRDTAPTELLTDIHLPLK